MEHRDNCGKCNKPLNDQDEAYICYYEITWCAPCTASFITSTPTAAANSLDARALVRRNSDSE